MGRDHLFRRLAGFVALVCALAFSSGASADRRETDLSRGWRFQFDVEATAPQAADFDDSAWERVTVPHTWNHIGEYRLERTSATNNEQGVGWYRLSFRAPRLREGQRHYLEFDGVGNRAEVWVNGQRVGEHNGAFSRFRLDVTEHLRPGNNLIAVSADNSPTSSAGSPTADIIPLAGDFFIHGGLYRGVRLISVDDAHIDLEDYGGPGIYARATEVSADSAAISVLTRLHNQSAAARDVTLAAMIRDARGRVVAREETAVALGAGARSETTQGLSIASPRLWNGRADPYLYEISVELREGRRVLDSVTQPLGVRSFRFDANEGFFLNGEYLQLVGASRHQDRAGRGWALTPADHAEDMRIMLEMGANTVRHAHYQHAQEWVEEANEAGLVVWAEVPYVSLASFSSGPPTEAMVQNARQQTIELIRQNYNHPSIFMWAVGNEIDVRGRFSPASASGHARALLEQLNTLAQEEDPSRPTAYADCCERAPYADTYVSMNGVTDLIGLNRYYGWYYGDPEGLGPNLDELHARYPNTPIAVSEYGAGGAFTQHTDNPQGGVIASRGRPHPEEFESWLHERYWLQLRDRRYIYAHWIWNMFDFSSNIRLEGDAMDINNKGLVSHDRQRRKDAFYFYQASWSQEPVLHITSRRYVNRAYPVLDVRAYSNADSATLIVNGEEIGATECPDRICVWRNVRLAPGENVVRAQARIGNRRLRDEVRWTAPDAEDGLRIESGELVGRESPLGRFGSDNFFTGGTPVLLNSVVQQFAPVAVDGEAGSSQRSVQGQEDAALFNAYREGDFSYALPVSDGDWRVRLITFEPNPDAAETRTFNVSANGQAVLTDFNPAAEAGGALRAVEHTFTATAINGEGVTLTFESAGGPAIAAAIVVTR